MSKNYDDTSDKENKERKYQEESRGREQRRVEDSHSSRSSRSSERSSSSGSQSSSGSSSSSSSSRSNSRSSRSSSSSSSHGAEVPTPQAKPKERTPRRSESRGRSRSRERRSLSHDRRSPSRSPNRRQRKDDIKRRKPEGGKSVRNEVGPDHKPRSPSPKRRRKRSPTLKPPRVFVNKISRNVHKEHIYEIFSSYGSIKSLDMPFVRQAYNSTCNRGFAYIEFESQKSADKALRMDGGQIDGQEVFCELADFTHVLPLDARRARTPPRNNYYPRGGMGWRRGPRFFRGRMRSPPRRWSPLRQQRRRSRSPVRHRHYSRSSSSNSR